MAEVASEVAIRALGRRGDGEFDGPDGPLHVAGALPGERVRVAVDGDSARLLDVLAPSPARAAPSCRHFGTCGGCMAQHMTPAFYREWKRGQLTTALARQGIAA
ncbi:MAG: hypothetical protein KGQ28_07300, partial [Hyphomicrobiales bacterium]|nr:hypothetical protein [Hyphomicrobiales bacterium]